MWLVLREGEMVTVKDGDGKERYKGDVATALLGLGRYMAQADSHAAALAANQKELDGQTKRIVELNEVIAKLKSQ